MSQYPRIENAIAVLKAAILNSSDEAMTQGLTEALVLVQQGIPELAGALSTAISALEDASAVVDKDDTEEYAYQAELESGRAALSRIEDFSYDQSNPDLEVQKYSRLMEVGEGDARLVYVKLLNEGRDAIMSEVVVYGMTEGFSRAAGHADGNYMRFHEHLHKNVGADLPNGLDPDSLYTAATEIADSDDMDGFSLTDMEEFAIQKGRELFHSLNNTSSPARGM